jgi:chromosome partitioning protein
MYTPSHREPPKNRRKGACVITLAVASQKGGVGKTTLALNTSLALARRGWRVLVVDADPQGAISLSLKKELEVAEGLTEFADGTRTLDQVVLNTRIPELSFLPVGGIKNHRPSQVDIGEPALGNLVDQTAHGFDLMVVDTASGLSGRTLSVLRTADQVLVPMQAEPLSVRTLQGVLETLAAIGDETGLSLAGIVLTMVQSRDDISLETVQEIWGLLPSQMVLEAFVPRDPAFLRASAHGVPVSLLSRRRPPSVAAVFDRIAAELEPRIGLTVEGEDEIVHLLD